MLLFNKLLSVGFDDCARFVQIKPFLVIQAVVANGSKSQSAFHKLGLCTSYLFFFIIICAQIMFYDNIFSRELC